MDEVTGTTEAVEASDPIVEAGVTPEGTSADTQVEAFTDLDPTEAPEGEVTPEWLQERYKQMQADYTRKRQADSETAKERAEELQFLESLRSDKDTQQAVLEQLQELLAESEGESGEAAEAGQNDPIAEKVAQLEQIEQQRQAQQLAGQVSSHIEQLAKDASVELDEDDMVDLFNRAVESDQVNNASTEAAFKAWHARQQAQREKWLKGYLASKQPGTQQVPSGQSATDKIDLSDRDTRVKRFAAILEGS